MDKEMSKIKGAGRKFLLAILCLALLSGIAFAACSSTSNVAPAHGTVTSYSSQITDSCCLASQVIDGVHGSCNYKEWATASQPTGWVKITLDKEYSVNEIRLYDRACPETTNSGHIEFSDGSTVSFGQLSETTPLTLTFAYKTVSWLKVYIDSSSGSNPGIAEVEVYGCEGAGAPPEPTGCPSGMLGYWKGESNANDKLSVYTGVPYGGFSYVTGKVGQAFKFDGIDDYVNLPGFNAITLFPSGCDFTIETWVNASTQSNWQVFLMGVEGYGRWGMQLANGNWGIALGSTNRDVIPATYNQWHHIVEVAASSGGSCVITFYDNGNAAGSISQGREGGYLGGVCNFGACSGPNRFFTGMVDELAVYNRPLTLAEIQEHYNNGLQGKDYCNMSAGAPPEPCPSGMGGYWKGEGNALDSSGNGNNGQLMNGATATTPGIVEHAFSFDGITQYVEIPHSNSLNLGGSLSLEAWIKWNGNNPTDYILLQKGAWSPPYSYSVQLRPHHSWIDFDYTTQSGLSQIIRFNYGIPANQWAHLVVTFDYNSKQAFLYANNQKISPSQVFYHDGGNPGNWVYAWINSPVQENTLPLRIGGSGASTPSYTYFPGLVDEVAVYNTVLTDAEVANHYFGGTGKAYCSAGAPPNPDLIQNSTGGTVENEGITVTVPQGALGTTELLVTIVPSEYSFVPFGYTMIGQPLDIGPPCADIDSEADCQSTNGCMWLPEARCDSIPFLSPVTITMPGDCSPGFPNGELVTQGIYKYSPWTGWAPLTTCTDYTDIGGGRFSCPEEDGRTTIWDTGACTITAQTYHFSTYAVIKQTQASGCSATGGTVTQVGDYTIHTFTSSGTFTVTQGCDAEVLVVAGGGGGGINLYHGSGGGAGGLIYYGAETPANSHKEGIGYAITASSHNVVVGNGGAVQANGQNSVFGTLTAIGGGYGAGYYAGNGGSGGSGGGCSYSSSSPGAGTAGQGYSGGSGAYYGSGGGGGAGSAGASGTVNGGNGGIGISYAISGTNNYYAGGGGGSAYSGNGGVGGAGGLGGGGAGSTSNAVSGTPNTGGGGGGGERDGSVSGTGGSGIVIIKYLAAAGAPTQNVTCPDGMAYKKVVTISSSSALSDYQVSMTVDTASLISAGKMKSDCSDIRFYDSTESTKLPYWLESGCNSASTKFWVKVPSISAGGAYGADVTSTSYTHFKSPGDDASSTGLAGMSDNTDSNFGWHIHKPYPLYAGLDFGSANKKTITKLRLQSHGNPLRDFAFQGSQDSTTGTDGTWTTLYTGTQTERGERVWQEHIISNTNAYRWYRIRVDTDYIGQTGFAMYEWEMLESAGANANKIYMYYGKPSASSESNGNNVFAFFDDFSSNTGWTIVGSAFISNGNANMDVAGTSDTYMYRPYTPSSDWIIEFTDRASSWTYAGGIAVGFASDISRMNPLQGYTTSSQASALSAKITGYPSAGAYIVNENNYQFSSVGTIPASLNTNYYLRFIKNGNSATLQVFSDAGRTSQISGSPITFSGVNLATSYLMISNCKSPGDNHITGWIDDLRIRQFTSSEPTVTIGSEESCAAAQALPIVAINSGNTTGGPWTDAFTGVTFNNDQYWVQGTGVVSLGSWGTDPVWSVCRFGPTVEYNIPVTPGKVYTVFIGIMDGGVRQSTYYVENSQLAVVTTSPNNKITLNKTLTASDVSDGYINVKCTAIQDPNCIMSAIWIEEAAAPPVQTCTNETTNIALTGTASASSVIGGYSIHEIHHLNDGLHGNSNSWIGVDSSPWAMITLPTVKKVYKVVFGRDNSGGYSDRSPGASLRVLYSTDGSTFTEVPNKVIKECNSDLTDCSQAFDGSLSAGQNVRVTFDPVDAKYIKIDQLSSQVCIDELEIYETTCAGAPPEPETCVMPNAQSLASNLKLWVDADKASSITKDGSNKVSQWNDLSGNSNNFVQGDYNRQPTYVASVLNSKPVVRISYSQTMNINTNFPSPTTVIYVSRLTGGSNNRMLSGINNNWLLGYWAGSKDMAHFDSWISPGGGIPSDTNWHLYTAVIPGPGQNTKIYGNGQMLYSNQNGVTGPNGLTLSGEYGEYSDGEIAEVIVYNKALSDTERADVEKYLASKYGFSGMGTCEMAAAPPIVCGNGAAEAGEECDMGDLNGQDCSTQGYFQGSLSCTDSCTFDVSGCQCQLPIPPCSRYLGVCAGLEKQCIGGEWVDCTEADYQSHSPFYSITENSVDTCWDGEDNDCNTLADKDEPGCLPGGLALKPCLVDDMVDFNGDGTVDSFDALIVLRSIISYSSQIIDSKNCQAISLGAT